MNAATLGLAGALAFMAWGVFRLFGVGALSRQFGAWAYSSALTAPEAALAQARSCNLNFLDVMVNGNGNPAWHCASFGTIRNAVRFWQSHGLSVSLTTWVRPRQDWAAGIAELGELCRELGCELTLDVEEPWTTAGASLAELEAFAAGLFAALRGVRVAGSAIVATDVAVVGPLLKRCDYVIPQTYATVRNAGSLAPGELERRGFEKFRAAFRRPVVLGAAAWNLTGAYDLTAAAALRASLREAKRLGCGVRFWNLGLLAGDASIREAARSAWGAA